MHGRSLATMPTPPALPLSAAERARLRALHLADQAAGARVPRRRAGVHLGVILAADLLLVVFGLSGVYAVGAAQGAVPPTPWSTVDVLP